MGHHKEIKLNNVKRVLVCMLKFHGDVLLSSPVYTSLKRALPEVIIDVYLFKDTLPMLEGHPAISSFITYDQNWRKLPLFKRLKREISIWREVRKRRYDMILNLTSGDRGAIVARLSKAKVRVGCESGGGLYKKDEIYTQLVRRTRKPRHIVERNLDLVRAIGICPTEEEKKLLFHVPQEAYVTITEMIPKKPFVLIHPTSRCDYKNWPAHCYREVIAFLKREGFAVAISGGPAKQEKDFVEDILCGVDPEDIYNFQGKLSLKELGALIKHSRALLTVDSVPSHMASALQKRALIIFGPSDDVKWGPWKNKLARVVRLDIPCKRCDQEGCGGSWMSDCLIRLPAKSVIRELKTLLEIESGDSLVQLQQTNPQNTAILNP